MVKTTSYTELGFIRLDRRKRNSLVTQLYESLRDAILSGQLSKGYRLPSTRALADDLKVSRTTVINAFEQLAVEGYLDSNVGRGTFVTHQLPEENQLICYSDHGLMTSAETRQIFNSTNSKSSWGQRLSSLGPITEFSSDFIQPFRPGLPALDEFPISVWTKLYRKLSSCISPNDLSYGDCRGNLRLREAIAQYVKAFRGVKCTVDQVFVVAGTQQAIDIVTRLSIDPGDVAWYENPGYPKGRAVLGAAGAKICSVRVDEDGFDVDSAANLLPTARLAYVTPSHQFPMGVTMSIERRLKLIEWARENNALIFEDDYDSEFRYAHRPIPSLQGLDNGGNTIYVGSFSKVVFPSLGMGYAVVPPSLVQPFGCALELAARPSSTLDQKVLAEFVSQGHFARHVRRMRKIYQHRREVLVESIDRYLGDRMEVTGCQAGLHCVASFKKQRNDQAVSRRLAEHAIIAPALSDYWNSGEASSCDKSSQISGLVLGFACATSGQIQNAVRRMEQFI